jgi:hypothetical protein
MHNTQLYAVASLATLLTNHTTNCMLVCYHDQQEIIPDTDSVKSVEIFEEAQKHGKVSCIMYTLYMSIIVVQKCLHSRSAESNAHMP